MSRSPELDPASATVPFATNHWTGVSGLALLSVGVGVVLGRPAVALVGIVGIGYAAYARTGEAPDPSLSVAREVDDDTPDPGDAVRVTLRVRNDGAGTLPDLRLVDGVPSALAVTGGSPRLGTALRPGKTATVTYTVTAVRGEHEWEPVRVITRTASGARERSGTVAADEPTVLRCLPTLEATSTLPLRGLTTQYVGRVATDLGGVGQEFHSVRRYRRGDPLNRVDWNRLARTGELATTEFHEERAATVVLLVDARESSYLAPDEDAEENAVERAVDAASQSFTALLNSGDRVGLAAFAPQELWLPPGTGADHRARARRTLATDPALSPTPTGGRLFPSLFLRRLRRRLPADAQVILFTPLADDYIVTVARRLDAYGHLVTVLSPDPTGEDTPGRRFARVQRRNRMSTLRRAGLRVLDWGEAPLASELAVATERWNR